MFKVVTFLVWIDVLLQDPGSLQPAVMEKRLLWEFFGRKQNPEVRLRGFFLSVVRPSLL